MIYKKRKCVNYGSKHNQVLHSFVDVAGYFQDSLEYTFI